MTSHAASSDRLSHARKAVADAGLGALLVTPGPDLRWLTGYEALPLERLTCLVLPSDGEPFLVAPGLEVPAVQASGVPGLGIEVLGWGETEDPYALIAGRVGRISSVGLANRMWAEQVLRFRRELDRSEQVTAGTVLRPLRLLKQPDEVAALRRAAQAIDAVHARMGEWLRPGRTEREVGRDIADAIIAAGHSTVNFIIVGSGPNGASPHHDTSERVIERGDPVVVDIGGTMPDGYCSDCTRTYVTGGEPDPEFARYYEVLLEAQKRSCDAVRPGVSAASIDAAARDVIAAAGYGEHFIHRTGHGIGLEEHEEPYIVEGNDVILEPGMSFSIEPGIYLSGRHGARIEDIVAVTAEGVERLDTVSRELVVLD